MIKMLQYKMYQAGELRCPTTALVKYCSYFSQKTGFDISCKLSPICMNCQILISGKNKKNINFTSAELGWRVVMVKERYLVLNLRQFCPVFHETH